MTHGLKPVSSDTVVYRIGRQPDPWAWPDWSHTGPDGTFGNRYDDPHGEYRTLYASSDRLGAFLETLAWYRPDPAIVATKIDGDARDLDYPTSPPGVLHRTWFDKSLLGMARISGIFADIGHSASIAYLREKMAARLLHYELDDLDAAAIRLQIPRRFTQEISRLIYDSVPEDAERYNGVRYLSRLGDEIENWAIFEPFEFKEVTHKPLAEDDADFQNALKLLDLKLV